MKLLKLDKTYVDPTQVIAIDAINASNTVVWLPHTVNVTVRMNSDEVAVLVENFLKDNA